MRVLVVTAHAGVVGGVETYLRAVLPWLRDGGCELSVAVTHPAVGGQPTIFDHCPDVPQFVVSDARSAVAVANDIRPDVVFSHDLPDASADDALARRYPVVRYAHNHAGLCVSGTKCHSAGGWQTCSRPLGLGCLVAYFPKGCGGRNPLTAGRLYLNNRARLQCAKRSKVVLVASEFMRREVVRNGVPADRVRVVPLFPPDVSADERPPAPRPKTDRVLFVGRLTPLKGLRELITAVQIAGAELGRQLKLVVVGDGPERTGCQAEAGRRGVVCEWHGWLDRADVVSQMRAADVLAVPSVWPEPFGLVGIEGGCVGLPAVAFATGGIPDWLTTGVTGESAPGNRPRSDELAAALVRALADADHWQRLRVGAWEGARRFTFEAHLNALPPVLRAVAG